jgi:hypothetical protein
VQTDLDVRRCESGALGDELVESYHDPAESGKIQGGGTSNRSGASSFNENGSDEAYHLKDMPKVTYSALN